MKPTQKRKEVKKLNIGCGKDIRKGWVNLDRHNSNGAEVVWDLNKLPLPFKDNEFDYILCSHVLEDFINPVPLMDEIVRITKKGGLIEIIVPNETRAWGNINHKKAFNGLTLEWYAKEKKDYGIRERVKIKEIHYVGLASKRKKENSWKNNLYWALCVFFANIFGIVIMSSTFIKHLFPLVDIRVVYEKIRDRP